MSNTIDQTKEAILKHGGKASKHEIARELKISLDYAGLVLGELKRKGEIFFSDGFYVLTPLEISRPKVTAATAFGQGGSLTGLTSVKKDVTQDKGRKKSATPSKRLKRAKKTKKPRIEKRTPHPLGSILGISESLTRTLEKAGYDTIESLADVPINKLMAEAKLKLRAAAQLINKARKVK